VSLKLQFDKRDNTVTRDKWDYHTKNGLSRVSGDVPQRLIGILHRSFLVDDYMMREIRFAERPKRDARIRICHPDNCSEVGDTLGPASARYQRSPSTYYVLKKSKHELSLMKLAALHRG